MRQFLIFAALFAAAACGTLKTSPSVEPYIFEDVINSTIEGLRPDIPDPAEIGDINLDLGDDPDATLQGVVQASNVTLSGLQGFQITHLNFQLLGTTLNLTINFPELVVTSQYLVDALVNGTNVTGDGGLSVLLHDLQIQVVTQVNLTGGLSVDNLRVKVTLGDSTFDIDGLYGDDELSQQVSDFLSENVPSLINDNQDEVSDVFSPIVEAIINAILNPASTPRESVSALIEKFVKGF